MPSPLKLMVLPLLIFMSCLCFATHINVSINVKYLNNLKMNIASQDVSLSSF